MVANLIKEKFNSKTKLEFSSIKFKNDYEKIDYDANFSNFKLFGWKPKYNLEKFLKNNS